MQPLRKSNRRPKPRPDEAMKAPRSGARIRMYRQGHGDCFLLAFSGEARPVYVLIDCGYKPGSNGRDYGLPEIDDVVENIRLATGGRLDLVVVTHEHQDHVNGFWRKGIPPFNDFEIGAAWFAWTEDPDDPVANELRKRHHDQLLGLVAARNRLATAAGDTARLDALLSFELGLDDPSDFAAASKDPAASVNKQAMKLVKDKATKRNTKYIQPHREILAVPGVPDVRVYALGPPRSPDLISDEEPHGSEAFPGQAMAGFASFFAAARGSDDADPDQNIAPFSRRFGIPLDHAFMHPQCGAFFSNHYGDDDPSSVADEAEAPDNARWRRIDNEWLFCAEEYAVALNQGINNTSLVLAFELPSGKVLLFVGDAQRGNWKSWIAGEWRNGDEVVTARDLLARTVVYKVGHHGSHNATLNGTTESDYPNLAWMAQGEHAREFTAMITAVRDWAYNKQRPPWRHPLPSIKDALLRKCNGRVFQTDTPELSPPADPDDRDWLGFRERTYVDPNGLYFEYEVRD